MKDKAHRLQQYLKWEGGWEALYYNLTTAEREGLFDKLAECIVQFEVGAKESENLPPSNK